MLAWFPIQRTIITKYLRSMYTITSYAPHLRFQPPYTGLPLLPGPPPAPPLRPLTTPIYIRPLTHRYVQYLGFYSQLNVPWPAGLMSL